MERLQHLTKLTSSKWFATLMQTRHYSNKGLQSDQKAYTPRRAVLYVPGSDRRKIAKAASVPADCVVLDCEDGVALSRKEEARRTIRDVLDSGSDGLSGKDCSVRVNSVDSGLCHLDLEHVLSGQRLPDTVHLPKVDTVDHVTWFIERVRHHVSSTMSRPLNIILFTESALGLLNLRAICERAQELVAGTALSLDGLVFGSDDYCADIGATRTSAAGELLFARQNFVMIARAFKLQAIDAVYIDYKDLDGLRRQAEEGCPVRLHREQVIHPDQVPVVQRAFSPSAQRAEWAAQLVEAFEQHQRSGQGAFTFRGHMVDRPLLLQAHNVLRLASVGGGER
ncbi:citramalyl-CoA lyase, mitochondrial-like isoform X2 [Pollicipes pollicipes]|nr:citramalyl-CoA lyase, mitochondrial-like isoform X2 [Pollicipes pollicipes]XP_037083285.1 citramalyl-CoA lyase, mitochondrial-like isoform X2 [Pollicipes pollicipes]XP_037083286.1 citramalyl-CoA lyase, mitochondrial-like isoform X2 [Pollicipes pollicipes]XP_037083287.1 citramalyl-CoA lyase, mitochondrial-like isoform X2 [Pollicipes pollicipes]XP_037083288.1 citramalyl-CoA lyase, mitochondrial-like isoform X2 [Pollicipes pollicipes]